MAALLLSLLILVLAPLAAMWLSRSPALRAGSDSFTLVAVLGLVCVHLMPEAAMHAGPAGFALMAAGLCVPALAERFLHHVDLPTHRIVLGISAVPLTVHGAADGALLGLYASADHSTLPLIGLLMHRFGAAVAIWWVFRPVFGRRAGFVMLGLLAATTVAGYMLMPGDLGALDGVHMGYLTAFASGSILHVVLHPLGAAEGRHQSALRGDRIGTAAGIGYCILMAVTYAGGHGVPLHLDGSIAPYNGADHPVGHWLHHALHDGHGHAGSGGDSIRHSLVGGHVFAVGSWLAPLAAVLHMALWWRLQRTGAAVRDTLRASFCRSAPVALAVWCLSILAVVYIAGGDIGGARLDLMLITGLWLFLVAAAAVHMGARQFMAQILPVHRHDHSHDHSHAHAHERAHSHKGL